MNHPLTDEMIQDIWNEIPAPPAHVETIKEIGPWVESYLMRATYDVAANKAITEARAMMEALVSDGSIDRQTYYDLIGEFEETMLPEEYNQ